jgi:hypothetical protein
MASKIHTKIAHNLLAFVVRKRVRVGFDCKAEQEKYRKITTLESAHETK